MKYFKLKGRISDFMNIAKIRLSFMNAMMPISGLYAVTENLDYRICFSLIIGNFCLASSSQIMGQIYEQKQDSIMERTKNRPLITKNISNKEAIIFSLSTFIIGNTTLLISLPLKSVIVSNMAFLLYYIYLRGKQRTPFSLYLGAIVGVLPIISGYMAISSFYDITSKLILDIIFMFNWQISHFIGILWKHNKDYQKAGFKMHNNKLVFFLVSTFFLIAQLIVLYNLTDKDNYHLIIKALMIITVTSNIFRNYFILTNSFYSSLFKNIWVSYYSLAFQYYILYSINGIKRN